MALDLNYKFSSYLLHEYVSSFSISDHPGLSEALLFVLNVALADSLMNLQDYPFLSEDFLPERVLFHSPEFPYFTNFNSVFVPSANCILPYSDYSLDIVSLSFFIYNITFLHLIVLGFIFTIVIVTVISLLLHRNLRVKRQSSFEQNNSNLIHNLYFVSN